MGDTERALIGRRTPSKGVPIFEIEPDDDLTPPPQVPSPDADISEVLREHAEALGRLWESRDLASNVKSLGQDVAQLLALQQQFLMPAVKTSLGRLDNIERSAAATGAKLDRFWDVEWPRALKTLEGYGALMGRIEKDVDRLERSVDAFMKRTDERHSALSDKLAETKADSDAEFAKLHAENKQQESRIRELEDFVLTVKSKVAIVSTLAGGGGAGLAWIASKLFGG